MVVKKNFLGRWRLLVIVVLAIIVIVVGIGRFTGYVSFSGKWMPLGGGMPQAACCYTEMTIVEGEVVSENKCTVTTEAECEHPESYDGVWRSGSSSCDGACDDYGACCHEMGLGYDGCHETTEYLCSLLPNNDFHAGETCDYCQGACCTCYGCLDYMYEFQCYGDEFHIRERCSEVACPSIGICCLPGGSGCVQNTQTCCQRSGGSWYATGTCQSRCMGACCDGTSCSIEFEEGCTDCTEVFYGKGTTCQTTQCPSEMACCSGDSCQEKTALECDCDGGMVAGTSCDPNPCVTPCCLDDDTCTTMNNAACESTGGISGGNSCDYWEDLGTCTINQQTFEGKTRCWCITSDGIFEQY
jgi:hypothetical protein